MIEKKDGLAAAGDGRLGATVGTYPDGIEVVFSGTAEVPDRPALTSLLERVHDSAEKLHAKQVRVDFRQLRFMTSACFKDFVTWLGRVRELPADKRYNIHFLSSPTIRWQRASLAALSSFAVDVVTIE